MNARTEREVRLLIVGPQGSDKGTQGELISERFGVPAISTGDLFREHIAARTDLGTRVQTIIEAGDLVPDELTFALVRERLLRPDAAAGFLLDGFPRNEAQVGLLDRLLDEQGTALDAVVVLDVPRGESIARLARRAAAQGRADDTDEVIGRRLDLYEKDTEPILASYRDRGILESIDGIGSVADIAARVFAALADRALRHR